MNRKHGVETPLFSALDMGFLIRVKNELDSPVHLEFIAKRIF